MQAAAGRQGNIYGNNLKRSADHLKGAIGRGRRQGPGAPSANNHANQRALGVS